MIKNNEVRKLIEVLKNEDNFGIIGHIRPDGDCIGSQIALYLTLQSMGKKVRMFNKGPIPDYYLFLSNITEIEKEWPLNPEPNILIFIDCGEPDRVYENFKFNQFSINIDHHQKNHGFGNINYVDPGACSVGEQIFNIIKSLKTPITKDIAECLYLSILADTGSFKFSNTNAGTFDLASKLVKAGANPSKIATEFYENSPPESIYLIAEVLSTMKFECGGKFVWGEINQEKYKKWGGEKNEPEGLVSFMRGIKGVTVSTLLHELKEGGLRAGLRSKDNIDVSRIARKLGGGGHINASGCYIRGNYEELKKLVIDTIKNELSEENKIK